MRLLQRSGRASNRSALVGGEERRDSPNTKEVKAAEPGLGLEEGVGEEEAGARAHFQFLAWAQGVGDVPTECGAWERNWFEEEDGKLYRGHIDFEVPMGLGQEVCSLGQATQPLWASVFSFVKWV